MQMKPMTSLRPVISAVTRWQRPVVLLVVIWPLAAIAAIADEIDFNRDVRPILADNCFECHGPDQESRQADLRLDVLDDELESVIVPGKPNVSVFIERLLSDDEDLVMPPPESKWRSTAKQIAILLLRRRICLLTSHLTLCSSLQPLINNVRINKRPILTKPFLSNLIEHPLL